jgi:hypothetical protein
MPVEREEAQRPLVSSPLGDRLIFNGEYSVTTLKISGPSLQPITLESLKGEDGEVKLAAGMETLASCATVMWLRIADETAAVEALSKAPLAAAHRDSAKNILFATEAGQVVAARAGARRVCPLCAKELATAQIALLHASLHITSSPSTLPYSEICPLCFGPSAKCPPFLVKSSTLQPRVVCSTYAPSASPEHPDRGVKFQAATLLKSNKTNPSTNRPIVCPGCHPDLADDDHKPPSAPSKSKKPSKRPAVWSYNMRAHWERVHPSSEMPEGLATAIKLGKDERAWLKDLP